MDTGLVALAVLLARTEMRLKRRLRRGERAFDDVCDSFGRVIRRGEDIGFEDIRVAATGRFRLALIDEIHRRIAEKHAGYETIYPLEDGWNLSGEALGALRQLSRLERSMGRVIEALLERIAGVLARPAAMPAMQEADHDRNERAEHSDQETADEAEETVAPTRRKPAAPPKAPGRTREQPTETSRLIGRIRRAAWDDCVSAGFLRRLENRELETLIGLERNQLDRVQREKYTDEKQKELQAKIAKLVEKQSTKSKPKLEPEVREKIARLHGHRQP
jgi:hypothetical protein